jgi:hypothetical protein
MSNSRMPPPASAPHTDERDLSPKPPKGGLNEEVGELDGDVDNDDDTGLPGKVGGGLAGG